MTTNDERRKSPPTPTFNHHMTTNNNHHLVTGREPKTVRSCCPYGLYALALALDTFLPTRRRHGTQPNSHTTYPQLATSIVRTTPSSHSIARASNRITSGTYIWNLKKEEEEEEKEEEEEEEVGSSDGESGGYLNWEQ